MGKVLIIKDADFSANGMPLGTTIDIASTLTLTRGYNMVGAAGDNRLATEPNVDLSSYISQGYSILIATIKSPTVSLHCLKMTNAAGTQEVRPSASYTTNELKVQLTSELPYLRYGTSKITGTYSSASYSADALAEIKLIKY